MQLTVKVVTKSKKNRLEKQLDGSYKAWVTAPPVDGKANRAVKEILSRHFGCPKSGISIKGGQFHKKKIFNLPV
jgi:uncharacterized protein YggU (UPF0235/DUF167 family)